MIYKQNFSRQRGEVKEAEIQIAIIDQVNGGRMFGDYEIINKIPA